MPREQFFLQTVVVTLLTAAIRLNSVSATLAQAAGCTPTAEYVVAELSKPSVSTATVGDKRFLISNAAEAKPPREKFKTTSRSAQNRPCCVSWGSGRIDCFVQGPEANVLHIQGVNGGWHDLGNRIIGDIECVSRDVDIIDVFVRDKSSRLCVNTYTKGQWSGWSFVGGSVMEVPSCVARTENTVDCMSRKMDGEYQHIESYSGDWTKRHNLGERAYTPMGCSAKSPDHFDCFFGGDRMSLSMQRWTEEDHWYNWQDLGVQATGRPSVVTWDANRIDVFVMAAENRGILHLAFDGAVQKPIENLEGVFDSAPECVTPRVGIIHCFAVGDGSYLYRNSFDGTKWTGWIRSFGFFLDPPSCVVSNKDEITCAARRFNKEVVFISYDFASE